LAEEGREFNILIEGKY